jgi:hypothetical protein
LSHWKRPWRLGEKQGRRFHIARFNEITGRDAEAYSNALAVGTLDPERSDVLSTIRKDFDAAGVVPTKIGS